MARKFRLEYPGAIYHVINRGNYRAWIFEDDRTKAAFEKCLFEACHRCGWVLHAFVVMGNHYHLAVETPLGNLVTGMQWLQSTFANRFNKFRGEHGHLFQGRFKALVVEEGGALGQVCHYLHLNPVRAGVVEVARLAEYRFSSYWYLLEPLRRPACLRLSAALFEAGRLADTVEGRQCYTDYLAWQAMDGPAGKNQAYTSLSRGWAIGGDDFKRALLVEQASLADARAWESEGAREVRAARWAAMLARCLASLPARATALSHKSAPWKTAVAAYLKESTDVPNGWLATHLGMGSHFYVSKHVGQLRRMADGEGRRWLDHLRTEISRTESQQTIEPVAQSAARGKSLGSADKAAFILDLSSRERDGT